jgi:uncharacterized CHY-type Zn-finger protein
MRPIVKGLSLDPQTRCRHWRSPLDIIAIRMWCCGTYYACRDCHDALADHPAEVVPAHAFDRPAVLCGACGAEFGVDAYLACENRCPACAAPFNPGCRTHHHLYFATAS